MKMNLGENMYIFLASNRHNEIADNLVISAHGGIRKKNSPQFTVPNNFVLQFYSDHGKVTDDFGLHNFANGGRNSQMRGLLGPNNQCYDYDLSKYQGRHNNANESYESIMSNQKLPEERRRGQFHQLNNVRDILDQGMQFPEVKKYTDFDVLTIRNRFGSGGVKLSEALRMLVDRNLYYRVVHCYFCRSFY